MTKRVDRWEGNRLLSLGRKRALYGLDMWELVLWKMWEWKKGGKGESSQETFSLSDSQVLFFSMVFPLRTDTFFRVIPFSFLSHVMQTYIPFFPSHLSFPSRVLEHPCPPSLLLWSTSLCVYIVYIRLFVSNFSLDIRNWIKRSDSTVAKKCEDWNKRREQKRTETKGGGW